MLDFLQLNVHRARLAQLELLQLLNNSEPTICLLQEPYTFKKRLVYRPQGYSMIPQNTKTDRPRAAICLPNEIQYVELTQLGDRDLVACLASVGGKKIVLASSYLDIKNSPTIPAALEALANYVNKENLALILAVDTNAHSSLYGPDTNRRGKDVEQFLLRHNLQLENVGQTPTFQATRASSCIDITITNKLPNMIKGWHVDQTYNASDHNTIFYKLLTEKITIEPRRLWSKMDWPGFSDCLKNASITLPENITDKKLDKLTTKLYSALNDAINKNAPLTNSYKRQPNNPWYDERLSELRERVGKAHKLLRSHPSTTNHSNYRRLHNKYKKLCRRKKKRSWREFTRDIPNQEDMARLHRILLKNERNNVTSFQTQEGDTTPGKDTAELLIKTHFPTAQEASQPRYKHKSAPTETTKNKFGSWLDCDKVKRALLAFENKKSPGPDGLRPEIFKHLPPNIINIITFVYKAAIELGYTPRQWRETKIVLYQNLVNPTIVHLLHIGPFLSRTTYLKGSRGSVAGE